MAILLFLLGLAVGSFLNVIALRYKSDGKLISGDLVFGRSYCPSCRAGLRWYELIPLVSFFVQLAKCRSCGGKISWQYPIIELLAGLAFVLVPKFAEPAPVGILVILILLLISLIDLRLSIIPDQLNLLLAFLGLAMIILFPGQQNVLDKFLGAGVGLAVFGLIILISRGQAMGMGDLKLAGALGLLFGWPKILAIIMIAFVVGGLFAALALFFGKKGMKDAIPFGPFLSTAAIVVIFCGDVIVNWYTSYLY